MTELIPTRIDTEVIATLRKQANEEGRTLSGIINKHLADAAKKYVNKDGKNGTKGKSLGNQ